jgi:transcriptional regulator with XRE-family HTH domain
VSGHLAKQIGRLLAEARKKAGLSQAQLGKLAGSNQAAVNRLEHAVRVRKRLTSRELEPYAQALKIPLSDLWPPEAELPPNIVAGLDAARAKLSPEDVHGWDEFIAEFARDISPRELAILQDLHYVKVRDQALGPGDWLLMWKAIRHTIDSI